MPFFQNLLSLIRRPKLGPAYQPIPEDRLRDLRDTDVFLVSFPRSGNTWVRHLLRDVIASAKPELPVPEKLGALMPIVHHSPPDHQALTDFEVPCRIFKSHNIASLRGRKMIYLFRRPEDALVSFFHFQSELGDGAAGTWNLKIDDFCVRAIPLWLEHMQYGLEQQQKFPERTFLACYEDLVATGPQLLRPLVDFIGLLASDETLEAVYAKNTIQHLRETAANYINKADRFFRKGRVGSACEELKPSTLALIEKRAGSVYRQLQTLATQTRSISRQ